VGEILLAHYSVPKVTKVSTRGLFSFLGFTADTTEEDIEICMHSEDLHQVEEEFIAEAEFTDA
jgi:hypothetical protein